MSAAEYSESVAWCLFQHVFKLTKARFFGAARNRRYRENITT
jgi:hypothetical protein